MPGSARPYAAPVVSSRHCSPVLHGSCPPVCLRYMGSARANRSGWSPGSEWKEFVRTEPRRATSGRGWVYGSGCGSLGVTWVDPVDCGEIVPKKRRHWWRSSAHVLCDRTPDRGGGGGGGGGGDGDGDGCGRSVVVGGWARPSTSIQPTTTGRARRTMMVTDGPWWVQLSVSLLAAGCFGSFLGGLVAFGLRDFLSIVMLIICPSFCCAVL